MEQLIEDKYLAASWAIIDKMQPGEIIIVKDYAPKNPALFISCIKQRIDTLNDCEFNEDYTKIRKLSDNCIFVKTETHQK
jgi:hypothetical protein